MTGRALCVYAPSGLFQRQSSAGSPGNVGLVSNIRSMTTRLTDFHKGFLLGLLIGEGHFGGDSRQPQITLRMHVRHAPLLRWVQDLLPGGNLYGPYSYAGRNSYQLMFRSRYLREVVVPLLGSLPWADIDQHSYGRFTRMLERYGIAMEPWPDANRREDLLGQPGPATLRELLDRLKSEVPRGTFSPLMLPRRRRSPDPIAALPLS